VQAKPVQAKPVQVKPVQAKPVQAKTARTEAAPKSPNAAATAKVAAKAAAKRPPPPRYYTQQQPTADRYREIQRALAERGYFQGSADGTWGSESVEALRRFQADQNLEVDGKLGSLSLIALGLGPRRDGANGGIESPSSKPVSATPEEHGVEPVSSEPSQPPPAQ